MEKLKLNGYEFTDKNAVKIRDFMEQLSVQVLGRSCTDVEIIRWVSAFLAGKTSGVQAVYEFIFGKNDMVRTLSDDEFVEKLYHIYFNRPSDKGGKTEWLNLLVMGADRMEIAEGFAQSEEFKRRCASYGIPYGIHK